MRPNHVCKGIISGLLAAAAAGSWQAASAQDFNGDGITDLAVGAPGESIGGKAGAGAVTIIYGAGPGVGLSGVIPLPSVQITQATFALDPIETGDNFGAAMAWGDFNGDPFDDLAISAPGEDHPVSGVLDAGMVIVLCGSPGGLIPMFPPLYAQDPPLGAPPLGDPAEAGDDLGRSLAAGDFNADGFDDLAIGVPGEDHPGGGPVDGGIVHVLYGNPAGLVIGPGAPVLWQGGFPWGDPSEVSDRFGQSLAVGDMDGNGAADLAIGVPFEDLGPNADCGMVNVIYGVGGGGPGLFPGSPTETWQQNTVGVPDKNEAGDQFGTTLAIGDFDGILGEDLAIGAPLEDVGAIVDSGQVTVIYSAGAGLGLDPASPPAPQIAELWHQNSPGVPELNAALDHFGATLAAGDFSGDPFADLAIGIPGEDVGGAPIVDAGSVIVIYGAGPGFGLDAAILIPAQLWSQNSAAIPDASEAGDAFGSALTVGDFDANGVLDLVVGTPLEDIAAALDTGCVNAIYGAPGPGLIGAGPVAAQLWNQNSIGIPDKNETGDNFGAALDYDD